MIQNHAALKGKIGVEMKRFIIIYTLFVVCGLISLDARLIDMYKKGTIRLMADPQYGKNTDWDELFYDESKWMTVAPDGSIFVTNSLHHNIFKFGPDGVLLKQFSRSGEGPGDSYFPANPSILDNKYLVINQYSEMRKISIFDFSGNIVKVIKPNRPPSRTVSLKNGKIAYSSFILFEEKKKEQIKVIIKDVGTGNEKTVDIIELPFITYVQNGLTTIGKNIADVFLRKTLDGNLLVGVSNSPDIKIFSSEGKLIRSFQHHLKPIEVTSDYINRFKQYSIENSKKECALERNPSMKEAIKKMANVPYEIFFAKYLPYYKQIQVDGEGNILVFKKTDCIANNCPVTFLVFSPEGKYICETKIDPGNFTVQINSIHCNIEFTDKGIFGLFSIKDSDDISLRLVKVKTD